MFLQEQLASKREKLMDQLEEAKKLKVNIDKRSQVVSQMLSRYLKEDVFGEYQHFIHTKVKLIMESRQVQDKMAVADEQLAVLRPT